MVLGVGMDNFLIRRLSDLCDEEPEGTSCEVLRHSFVVQGVANRYAETEGLHGVFSVENAKLWVEPIGLALRLMKCWVVSRVHVRRVVSETVVAIVDGLTKGIFVLG